jgi:hypothetical protein
MLLKTPNCRLHHTLHVEPRPSIGVLNLHNSWISDSELYIVAFLTHVCCRGPLKQLDKDTLNAG